MAKRIRSNSYWRMPERLYDDPDELADGPGLRWRAKRRKPRRQKIKRTVNAQATLAPRANSGSVSQITRLRPLRLAA